MTDQTGSATPAGAPGEAGSAPAGVPSVAGAGATGADATVAWTEIERIMGEARGNERHAYFDTAHPEHASLHARLLDLHGRIANPHGAATTPAPALSAASQARFEIEQIMGAAHGNAKHAYWDASNPQHSALHERLLALHARAAAEPAPGQEDAGKFMESEYAAPEAPAEYERDGVFEGLKLPDHLPPDVRARDIPVISAWAHGAQATRNELRTLVSRYSELAPDPTRADPVATERALRSIWGDAYGDNVAAARRAVAMIGDARLITLLEETGLGNDAVTIREFANIARRRGW